jgi:hypothetical protein
MANQGIEDIGLGIGYLYKVDVDGTTILQPYLNTEENARNLNVEGLKGTAVALKQRPTGTITVDTITGSGNITAITVGGWDQIGAAIPYTGGVTTVSALAALINTAINNFDNGSNKNYTAIVTGAVVTLVGDDDTGSDDNGDAISVVNTGNSTYTTVAINGGSDATELYNQSYGFRFFINADYDASGCSGAGSATADSLTNAIEITRYIVPRTLTSAIDVQNLIIVSGALTITRKSILTEVFIDTESSAGTDDLDTISVTGFADGDTIVFRGENSGRITTFKDGTGNIELQSANDFDTADLETAITVQLIGSSWYEVSRTSQSIGVTADYRTAGFGFFGIDTFNTAAVATSGTVTFNGGTDSKYQKLTGGVTLIGNSSYALGTGVNGDKIVLEYDAAVTEGAFALSIFGITLTTEQALNGGLIFEAEYKSGAWYPRVYPNLNDGATYTYQSATESYKNDSVTIDKVSDSIITELLLVDVSFETGRLGDYKIKFPYACTVVEINSWATNTIEISDDADLNFKDNSAASMGSGSFTAGDTIGTGISTITPSTNNTFAVDEMMTITSTKGTVGGDAKCSIKIIKS